jgi:hypothetical protein
MPIDFTLSKALEDCAIDNQRFVCANNQGLYALFHNLQRDFYPVALFDGLQFTAATGCSPEECAAINVWNVNV